MFIFDRYKTYRDLCVAICISVLSSASCAATSSGLYQVDMLMFLHEPLEIAAKKEQPMLKNNTQHAITLQAASSHGLVPYRFLSPALSQLNREYYTLRHQSKYQVLLYDSWLQPKNNQRSILFDNKNTQGWKIEGTVRVRQSNYYLLDTELLFTNERNPHIAFLVSQKMRLKPGVVYYLDHPYAGILIKVHAL